MVGLGTWPPYMVLQSTPLELAYCVELGLRSISYLGIKFRPIQILGLHDVEHPFILFTLQLAGLSIAVGGGWGC